MTIRVAGTTFENHQEHFDFLKQFHQEDLTVTLERERNNKFNSIAIQTVVHIKPIFRKTVIWYVPKGLAKDMVKVIDMGI